MVLPMLPKHLQGAGIGVGVAVKLGSSPLVTIAAAVSGMIGAFPTVNSMSAFALGKPGEPLGAFVAAYVAIEIGRLVSGKTKVDIIVTPFACICIGSSSWICNRTADISIYDVAWQSC